MPRKVRDSNLETRTARGRLRVAHKPYFRLIEPKLHLGYRKLASGPGTWIVRRYSGKGAYTAKNLTTADEMLVVADDFSEPDGNSVLSFGQAQERAKAFRPARPGTGPYTVADAMTDYVAWLESRDKPTADASYRYRAHIQPHFETTPLAKLTTERLRKWLADLARQPPRLRTRPGESQRFRETANDGDAKRRRQAAANRTWTVFKAALNRAWREGKVDSDSAWRRVESFMDVDAARVRILTVDQSNRLLRVCAPDFRMLIQAALLTGGRYGQLAALAVDQFNPQSKSVTMRSRKGKGKEKVFNVVLTNEGVTFFKQACAGRGPDDLMFKKSDGTPWGKSHQSRPMIEACKRAKIAPPIGIHALRHSWASLSLMNGMPPILVAKNLGHADTRMVEKNYGHFIESFAADTIRTSAPKFGFKATNVRPLRP